MSDEERRAVLTAARRQTFQKGDTILREGDPGGALHLLVSGTVAVRTTTPLGEVVTFAVLGAGDCFGEQAALAGHPVHTADVQSLGHSETLSLSSPLVAELRRKHAAIDRYFVGLLAAQVRRLSDHLVEALFEPAERRVLRRLCALVELYGSDGTEVVVPLTQEELASLAGTTRPTANRVLRAAEDEGLLRISRARITLYDVDRLRRRAS